MAQIKIIGPSTRKSTLKQALWEIKGTGLSDHHAHWDVLMIDREEFCSQFPGICFSWMNIPQVQEIFQQSWVVWLRISFLWERWLKKNRFFSPFYIVINEERSHCTSSSRIEWAWKQFALFQRNITLYVQMLKKFQMGKKSEAAAASLVIRTRYCSWFSLDCASFSTGFAFWLPWNFS